MTSTIPRKPSAEAARAELDEHLGIRPATYATLWDTSLSSVYAGIHDGTIPVVRLGRKVIRIPSDWVREQLGARA